MYKHIVQSKEWSQTKAEYGTQSISCGDIYYTTHAIPLSPYSVAYCPKVDPFLINWENLKKSLKENRCVAINFDVPNVQAESLEAKKAEKIFSEYCIKSPKSTFAGHTVLVDISKTEEEILKGMHSKHRYNIGIAQSRGATIRLAEDISDYNVFYKMLGETAIREHYYIRPRNYYLNIWQILKPLEMCEIVICEHQGKSLGTWMLLFYKDTLYYPYGGSANMDLRNKYNPGNLIGWEAIKIGKSRGCKVFDMWGATGDLENKNHPWWGFTNFKIKFGGTLVKFMDSYDCVLNPKIYTAFTLANKIRWKILRLIR